jgi:site-specific recombinase XerD
MMDKEL